MNDQFERSYLLRAVRLGAVLLLLVVDGLGLLRLVVLLVDGLRGRRFLVALRLALLALRLVVSWHGGLRLDLLRRRSLGDADRLACSLRAVANGSLLLLRCRWLSTGGLRLLGLLLLLRLLPESGC